MPVKISRSVFYADWKIPTIVHFEIAADDIEKTRKFYSSMFGWKIEKAPGMEYRMFSTNKEQTFGGGLMKRQQPQQTIANYIDVSSIDEYAKKVKLGGRVKVQKTEVPGMGWYARCSDTENNMFGLWETKPQ